MQGTQYPTSNLVMPQLHQIISGLQMPKITYEMKLILKARTQMVESIYKYFDLDLSESHRAKLYV